MMRKYYSRICDVSATSNSANTSAFNYIGMCIYLKEGFILLRMTTGNMTDNMDTNMMTDSMTSMMTTVNVMINSMVMSETDKEVAFRSQFDSESLKCGVIGVNFQHSAHELWMLHQWGCNNGQWRESFSTIAFSVPTILGSQIDSYWFIFYS